MHKKTRKILTVLLSFGLTLGSPCGAWAAAAKVVLDPGHGGSDPGAVGVNGLYEKEVNLDVVLLLRDELAKRGYEVSLTRDKDVFLTLAERVEYTNGVMPDLFVSVHANSHSNSETRGSMVLYYDKDYPQADYPASSAMITLSPESKKLARLVQTELVREAGTADKGLVPSAVYVARMGSVPSILVETAFLSNAQDAALLADAGFRQKLALGIAAGISAYIPAEKDGLPGSAAPGAFPDVPASHWANESIQKLKDKGIVQGDNGGRFYPNRALTRAEFAAMLDRFFPIPDVTGCGGESPQTPANPDTAVEASVRSSGGVCSSKPVKPSDLPVSHWAYTPVLHAVEQGLLTGYADGTVRPDRSLTRGEAAAMIARVIEPKGSQTDSPAVFKDVPKTLWSAPYINRLKAKGIIDGVTADTFAPERSITRAEMSALLARMIP